MTGIALLDFLISLIILAGVLWIFFLVIPRVSPDPLFTTIAQVVVGIAALIVFILAVAAVLGFGGTKLAISGAALLTFAIAVIVGLLVLYIVNLFLDWLAGQAPPIAPFVGAIKYIIGALVLIALLYIAGTALFGGGGLPSINLRHGELNAPFWFAGISGATLAAHTPAPATRMHRLLNG